MDKDSKFAIFILAGSIVLTTFIWIAYFEYKQYRIEKDLQVYLDHWQSGIQDVSSNLANNQQARLNKIRAEQAKQAEQRRVQQLEAERQTRREQRYEQKLARQNSTMCQFWLDQLKNNETEKSRLKVIEHCPLFDQYNRTGTIYSE